MAKFSLGDSAINTALLSSLFDLSNAQKVLAGAVFGFTDKFRMIDTANAGKIDDESKETMKLLNETAKSLSAKLDELKKEEKKAQNDDKKKSSLEYLATISDVFGNDDVKSKRFIKTIGVLDKFIRSSNSANTARLVFQSITQMCESMEKIDVSKAGKGLGYVAVGLTAVGLAIFAISKVVTFSGMLMTGVIMSSVLAFAYGLTKLNGEQLDKSALALARMGGAMVLVTASVLLMSKISMADILKGAFMFVALSGAMWASNKLFGLMRTTSVRGFILPLAPVAISASIGIMAGSIWTWNQLVPNTGEALAPVMFMLTFTTALALINKVAGKGRKGGLEEVGRSMLFISASLGVLALSIKVWDILSPQQIAKPVLAIVALSLGLALMNRLAGGDMKKSAVGLVIASASVAILAIAIKVWDVLGIDTDMIALPALAITGLMVGLALVAKMGGGQVLMASGALIMTGIAIGVVAYGVKQWNDVDSERTAEMMLIMVELGVLLVAMGSAGAMTLAGAGALIIAGGAVYVMGKGLQEMDKVSGSSMGASMLFITGLGAAVALLGAFPLSIAGAGALLIGGYAMIKIGEGLQAMSGFDFNKSKGLTDLMGNLVKVFIDAGGIITTPLILAGAVSFDKIGDATLKIAKTLKILADSKMSSAEISASADSISLFMKSMLGVFDGFEGSYRKVRKGIDALAGLGNMIGNLADGMVKMGRLTFVEYGVVDNKLVPVSAREFTKNDFERVGDGLKKIIDAVTTPLATVGSKSDLFGNDVGRGVKALVGLGNLLKGLAEGVAGMASMQFTEYDVVNGKLVPVATRKFREDGSDFEAVGKNFKMIIDAVTKPLSNIGSQSGWFSSSDVEKGIDALKDLVKNVINPMGQVVDFVQKTNLDPASATRYAVSFGILVGGIAGAVKRLNGDDLEDAGEGMEGFVKNVKELTESNDGLARARMNFERIARGLSRINTELSNDRFRRIVELKETMEVLSSNKMYDTMLAIVNLLEQRLVPIMQGVNNNLTQTTGYITGQMNGAPIDPNNPLMAGQTAMLSPYTTGGSPFGATGGQTPVTQADLESLMSRFEDILINNNMQNKNR